MTEVMQTTNANELRAAIREMVPARVAKRAGVQTSTIYSFVEGSTANVRTDTQRRFLEL